MLRAVLGGYGRSGRDLDRLFDGLWMGVGRSWRGFGCHVGAQDGSEIRARGHLFEPCGEDSQGNKILDFCYGSLSLSLIGKSAALRGRSFQSGFLMDFVAKISSAGDHNIFI